MNLNKIKRPVAFSRTFRNSSRMLREPEQQDQVQVQDLDHQEQRVKNVEVDLMPMVSLEMFSRRCRVGLRQVLIAGLRQKSHTSGLGGPGLVELVEQRWDISLQTSLVQ